MTSAESGHWFAVQFSIKVQQKRQNESILDSSLLEPFLSVLSVSSVVLLSTGIDNLHYRWACLGLWQLRPGIFPGCGFDTRIIRADIPIYRPNKDLGSLRMFAVSVDPFGMVVVMYINVISL